MDNAVHMKAFHTLCMFAVDSSHLNHDFNVNIDIPNVGECYHYRVDHKERSVLSTEKMHAEDSGE